LAGVRNFNKHPAPVSEPKGEPPEEMVWRDCWKEFVDGDHSASWLTLAEMKAYDASWLYAAEISYAGTLWGSWITAMEFAKSYYGVTDDSKVVVVFNFDT
jgi:hypothetical protein